MYQSRGIDFINQDKINQAYEFITNYVKPNLANLVSNTDFNQYKSQILSLIEQLQDAVDLVNQQVGALPVVDLTPLNTFMDKLKSDFYAFDQTTANFGNYTVNEFNELMAKFTSDFYEGNFFAGDTLVPKVGQFTIAQFDGFVNKLYADLYMADKTTLKAVDLSDYVTKQYLSLNYQDWEMTMAWMELALVPYLKTSQVNQKIADYLLNNGYAPAGTAVDMTQYYTKTQSDNNYYGKYYVDSTFYDKTYINDVLTAFYDKPQIDSKLATYATLNTTGLVNYYNRSQVLTTTQLAAQYYNRNSVDILLQDFYNKTTLDTKFATYQTKALNDQLYATITQLASYLTKAQIEAAYITAASIQATYAQITQLQSYYTKTQSDARYYTMAAADLQFTTPTDVASSIATNNENYFTKTDLNNNFVSVTAFGQLNSYLTSIRKGFLTIARYCNDSYLEAYWYNNQYNNQGTVFTANTTNMLTWGPTYSTKVQQLLTGSGDPTDLSGIFTMQDVANTGILINTNFFLNLLNTAVVKETIGILPSQSVATSFKICFELDFTFTYVVDSQNYAVVYLFNNTGPDNTVRVSTSDINTMGINSRDSTSSRYSSTSSYQTVTVQGTTTSITLGGYIAVGLASFSLNQLRPKFMTLRMKPKLSYIGLI